MLNEEDLRCAAERIARHATSPATVIVFGSYASGKADEASDLDLLVIERDLPNLAAEYLRLRSAVGRLGVGVDLLLMSQNDFDRRSKVPGTMPHRARVEGKILHDPAR